MQVGLAITMPRSPVLVNHLFSANGFEEHG
jgi:hypothetical protein